MKRCFIGRKPRCFAARARQMRRLVLLALEDISGLTACNQSGH